MICPALLKTSYYTPSTESEVVEVNLKNQVSYIQGNTFVDDRRYANHYDGNRGTKINKTLLLHLEMSEPKAWNRGEGTAPIPSITHYIC